MSTRYNEEAVRLESFHSWTIPFIDKEKLALYGFFFLSTPDTVKCHFCKVEIGKWDVGDNVLREHLRWSPYCPLLKRQATDNVPLNSPLLENSLPPSSFDICGNNSLEIRPNAYPENEIAHFVTNHPDYSLGSDRLKSFDSWPIAMKQTPTALSEAGFFYIGRGDQVKCFSCGGGLKEWDEEDIPWEQHALCYPKCPYVILIKGPEYIAQVKSEHEANGLNESRRESTGSTTAVPHQPTSMEKLQVNDEKYDSKLCKICFDNDIDTALFPCMHIIACAKCAVALKNCPICRKAITDIKRIYFS